MGLDRKSVLRTAPAHTVRYARRRPEVTIARYLRFHPQLWTGHITMRVEAYGYAVWRRRPQRWPGLGARR